MLVVDPHRGLPHLDCILALGQSVIFVLTPRMDEAFQLLIPLLTQFNLFEGGLIFHFDAEVETFGPNHASVFDSFAPDRGDNMIKLFGGTAQSLFLLLGS